MRILTEVPKIGRLPFFYYVRKDVTNVVKINGCELDIAGKTLAEYLSSTEYDPQNREYNTVNRIMQGSLYQQAERKSSNFDP